MLLQAPTTRRKLIVDSLTGRSKTPAPREERALNAMSHLSQFLSIRADGLRHVP